MTLHASGDLGNLLGIWAHPDDEAWLTAGLMMRAIAAGQRVTCVTATQGEAGFPVDDPRSEAERMAVRAAEMAASLAVVGVTDHRWLGYRDGRCDAIADEEVVPRLVSVIEEVDPDVVLTFAPDGGTGHPDHVAACRWATQAVRRSGRSDIRLLYATKTAAWLDLFRATLDPADVLMTDGLEPEATPEERLAVWFQCDDALLARKVASMRAQVSQIEPLYAMVGPERFAALVKDEYFRDPRAADPF